MYTVEQLQVATRHIIEAAPYSFLITLDADGKPYARLMEHYPMDSDMNLWFGTDPQSRKMPHLKAHPDVAVTFELGSERAYVSVYGVGEIVFDQQKRSKYWREGWEVFFPGGAGGDRYCLVKVIPHHIEVMNFEKEIIPTDPAGLTIPTLIREGDSWRVE